MELLHPQKYSESQGVMKLKFPEGTGIVKCYFKMLMYSLLFRKTTVH